MTPELTLRDYQRPLYEAFEKKGYKRLLAVWPRRAGKDIISWNLLIRYAINNKGVYYIIYPTYSQGRKILWDSITNDGHRFLDYIQPSLIEKCNSQEMKVYLVNGSLLQVVGSDNVDSIVGTNPRGCIFSEYALQDPRAYQFIRPILAANGGFAIFISTPRGKNSFWELYKIAQDNPQSWFCQKLTLDDTKHIPLSEIDRDRSEGVMSEEMIQQEYYTDFSLGVEGAYYAKYIDKLRLASQITTVPWDPSQKTFSAFDLGVRDKTSIIVFQSIGPRVHIIDYYENSKEGLEHYIDWLKSRPYSWAAHIAPHDIRVKDFGTGLTRWEKARQLGFTFEICDNIPIIDGIEAVRSTLMKCWIDEQKCAPLIKALENYRAEYDAKKRIFNTHPLHNEFSHAADAMRYLCLYLPKLTSDITAEELDKRYNQVRYGSQAFGPNSVFNTRK